MLGREPRLPHKTLRWLIIALMLINGVQLVLLQLAINSSALYDTGLTLWYAAISGGLFLLAALGLAYAFLVSGRRRAGRDGRPERERGQQ